MKLWQRLILIIIYSVAVTIAFLVPIYRLVDKLIIGQQSKAQWAFSVALGLGIIGGVGAYVIKRTIDRRLQSIDVADELGINGTTPVILKRVLLLLQFMLPLIIVKLALYGLTMIPIPSHKVFDEFIWWFASGFAAFILHDYLKRYFREDATIRKALKLDRDKEKKIKKQQDKIERNKKSRSSRL